MKELITKANKEALEAEYRELSGPRRTAILEQLTYAKSLGDLSENAEYHQARENQAKLEERLHQIEHVLKNAEVVEGGSSDIVSIGSTVVIQKLGESNTRTFVIVGSEETDMLSGKISYKSPLGQALFEKKVGEKVSVTTPKGDMTYEIKSIG
jgi:transcription elongation factor GreA